ncbi:hypothetical protein IHN32_02250 [Deinococcus sp. 14RED07]|uniref:hypothetical protein n=1 Tax=Deinococcus sp. 14RED07 TaxID=2745874 RepID=UPI001E5098A1|nr:hypothetical protein [Deinococcus sp. 14RED07]MCD0174775.1 hypothetical protein [Deinococcus sp. 14RED07]
MNRARIDVAFEAFVEARRQCGLGPAGERFFRDAWAAFRALPGSHRPTRDTMRSLRRQRPGDNRDAAWRRARALHPILAFLQASRAIGQFPLPAKPPPRRVEGRPLMTEREIASLERAIADPGVQALAALVYRTGLRAVRLIELQPDQVDLPDRSLQVPVGRTTRMVSLSLDAQATLRSWQAHRNPRAATLLHDPAGRPLTLKAASSVLRAAGQRSGRPALGFGHLQYAHTRLLARSFPEFSQDLLELRTGQPFRLRFLRIPDLFGEPGVLRLPASYVSPVTRLFAGEDL